MGHPLRSKAKKGERNTLAQTLALSPDLIDDSEHFGRSRVHLEPKINLSFDFFPFYSLFFFVFHQL